MKLCGTRAVSFYSSSSELWVQVPLECTRGHTVFYVRYISLTVKHMSKGLTTLGNYCPLKIKEILCLVILMPHGALRKHVIYFQNATCFHDTRVRVVSFTPPERRIAFCSPIFTKLTNLLLLLQVLQFNCWTVLAFSTASFHLTRSWMCSVPITFKIFKFPFRSFSPLFFGLPPSPVYVSFHSYSFFYYRPIISHSIQMTKPAQSLGFSVINYTVLLYLILLIHHFFYFLMYHLFPLKIQIFFLASFFQLLPNFCFIYSSNTHVSLPYVITSLIMVPHKFNLPFFYTNLLLNTKVTNGEQKCV